MTIFKSGNLKCLSALIGYRTVQTLDEQTAAPRKPWSLDGGISTVRLLLITVVIAFRRGGRDAVRAI